MAEAFRKSGFDGVAYRSALGEGHNIALFDLDAAKVVNCSLIEARAIQYEFSDLGETDGFLQASGSLISDGDGRLRISPVAERRPLG